MISFFPFLFLFFFSFCFFFFFAAELLGVSYPQPYADPGTTGAKIFSGVNYASAAAGILDETGQNYVSYFLTLELHYYYYLDHRANDHR